MPLNNKVAKDTVRLENTYRCLQMLYVVVGRGEGRDVRQGGAAHRGVGTLALGHALRGGNFVMTSLSTARK